MLNMNFTPFPTLSTERLTLRQVDMNDAQEVFALRSDEEVNKYIDRNRAQTIDDAKGFIKMINEKINNNESMYWAIMFTGSKQFVGTACLFSFSEQHQSCEIGYELLPKFQGQGLMQEAIQKVIDYGFHTIQLQTIEAVVNKDNHASINLLKKLPFKESTDAVDENFVKWKSVNKS
jgi:ribosomal-protein-alanine N-acetyltransferase